MIRSEHVLGLVRQQPFKPFRIHMSDGEAFDIRHPEVVMVFRDRVVVGIPAEHGDGLMQDIQFCSMLHISRLEQLADAG